MTTLPRPTSMDLTMHRMAQTHPSNPQTIGVVLHLDGAPPSLAELRGHIANHLHDEPRLTHHLHGSGLKARWRDQPAPDLDTRVRSRHVPPGDSHLNNALHELVAHPLPGTGPLWDVWLLSGYATDRYAICWRAHHSTQDGMGLVGTLHTLFGTTAPPAAAPAGRAGVMTLLHTVRSALVAHGHGFWTDPARTPSGTRVVNWTSVPTQQLRAAAVARGGDTNDAFLAALSGALRTWCADNWPAGAGKPLSAITMINLRRSGERTRPGNLCTFAPVPLPCEEPTAETRLDRVIAATRATKDPARQNALRALMDLTPARAFYALADRLTSPARAPMTTSYVAIHRPLSYRGDPVTHVQPFTWLPRNQPASVVACSYNGTTSVCFVSDAALPGVTSLPALFDEAAGELSNGQLGSPAEPPGRTTGPEIPPPSPAPADENTTQVVIDFSFVKDLLVDHGSLPAEPITQDATQSQAGIDSMAVTTLSMALEDRIGLLVTEDDLAQAATVADLVDLIARRAALPTPSNAPSSPAVDHLT